MALCSNQTQFQQRGLHRTSGQAKLALLAPCPRSHSGAVAWTQARPSSAAPTVQEQQQQRLRVSPQASSSTTGQQATHRTSFGHGITYTSYEVNTFTIKFASTGVRVLIDPWLVGNLSFAQQDWFYTGKKRAIGSKVKVDLQEIASETDVLVLTQALDDHTHIPTLKAFPKTVPVIAQPDAAAIARSLGFTNVRTIDHGQSLDIANGKLRITATVGALVGPPWSKRQLGLVFREQAQPQSDASTKELFKGASLYFEPHCDFDESSVARVGQVDVVVSPVKTALLGVGPAAYPLTMGDINLVKLCKLLRPQVLVPLLNSEIDHDGPLAALIMERGSYDEVRNQLASAGLGSIRVEFPSPPGEAMAIAL